MNFALSLFGGEFFQVELKAQNSLNFFERFFMFEVDVFKLFFKILVFFLQFFVQNDLFLVPRLF
jgi:hypothetical protein